MRIHRNFIAISALATVLAACGGAHGMPALNSHGGTAPLAQVAFSIALPPKKSSARHPYYVSGMTAYAEITVTNAGGFNQKTEIACLYPTCSGSVVAPIGSDTFAVNLVDSTKTEVLSTGTATQSISAGSNTVNLTFNPVVAAVALLFDSSSWTGGASPALDPVQHTSMLLDVSATDASGQTIVGPGKFVDANGNPITVTLANSDAFTTLSNTTFTTPGGTTTLAVKSGLQHASPYEDTIITVSAPGVSKIAGLAVAFAPTLLSVAPNSAFGTISGMYGNTAIATTTNAYSDIYGQVDFNAVGNSGLTVSPISNAMPNTCGSIGNLTGGTIDTMLYFVFDPGRCGSPPPGGWALPNVYQANPVSHNITAIALSNSGQYLSGPLGVGADGNIWYVETDSVSSLVHLCHYANASNSCTSALPAGTNVQAFMPGPGGETMAAISGGGLIEGVALVSSSMTVTTHDLSSSFISSAANSWGYSSADKQLYLWVSGSIMTVDTSTWQVTSTRPIYPGNPGFGISPETGSGPMTALSDGSFVVAGDNGAGVNGVIFHIHPSANGPIVSQEVPLACAGCGISAGNASLLPDGTITEAIVNGVASGGIEYATW